MEREKEKRLEYLCRLAYFIWLWLYATNRKQVTTSEILFSLGFRTWRTVVTEAVNILEKLGVVSVIRKRPLLIIYTGKAPPPTCKPIFSLILAEESGKTYRS